MKKKKIKDLKAKERKAICKKYKNCYKCPLGFTYDCGSNIHCSFEIVDREVIIGD